MSDADSSDGSGTAFVEVKVAPDPGFTLVFDGMIATEELGRPFLIQLDLSSDKAQSTIASILGSSVTLTLTAADNSKRYFNGIVARMGYAGMTGGAFRYHIELRPWIWLLTRTHDCKIFQNQSAWDIITQVFSDAGFSGQFEDKRQNQAGSTVLEYCVQYRESSFDFVVRLMEQFGIYYFVTHQDGQHTLMLSDDPNSHTSVGAAIPFQFAQTEVRGVEDHVWDFSADLHLQPGAYTYRDYNFTTPAADLTTKSLKPGEHPYGTYEVYDYPGPYDTTDNGQKQADVRMQDLAARAQAYTGFTNSRLIATGAKFTLSKFQATALNQEYLLTRTVTTIAHAEGAADTRGELIDSYRCEFSAIPGTVQFRLDMATPKPLIRGPQTAKVVGNSGDEITTDQYGRIKVQFYWDRIGTNDENSSCWIRVAQTWGGAGWGSMFIPRIGMEVVVEFLEGNPDRPLVTGVVYNANQTVPYGLPAEKTKSTIKSNSSQGGGGYNEFRFEDKKGSEEVYFQAQKDYNKVVLNNETSTITQDTTTTVKQGNRSVTVSQGNDSHTVSTGNLSVTVSQGNHSTTVSLGNHSLNVSAGTSGITAMQSITLTCGPSSIKLAPSGITISAPQFSLSAEGTASLSASTSMSLTAGMISIN